MKISQAAICSALLAAFVAGCGGDAGSSADVDDGAEDFAQAQVALANGETKIAARGFAEAARKCETNFEARLQLALANIKLGEVDGAVSAAAAARALRPDSAEALLVAGQAAYLKRDYDAAVDDFNAVVKDAQLLAALRSAALAARAVVEIGRQDVDAARITLFTAKRLDPRNAAAWYHLGCLSRDVYRFTEAALEQFEVAVRLMDARDERAERLSRTIIPALREQRQQEAAARPGAQSRNPGEAARLIAEGQKLQGRRRMRDAIAKYAAALKADPLSDVAALAYAELQKANLPKDRAAAAPLVEKVLAAYRVVIDENPSVQKHYLAAARLAYDHQLWMQAAAIMDRAISHDAENKQTLDLLVASLLKAGKTKQAGMWRDYRQNLK